MQAVKAVFEVTLVIPKDLIAFSNMPEVESSEKPNGAFSYSIQAAHSYISLQVEPSETPNSSLSYPYGGPPILSHCYMAAEHLYASIRCSAIHASSHSV